MSKAAGMTSNNYRTGNGSEPAFSIAMPQAGRCRNGNIFAKEVSAKMSSRSLTNTATPNTGLNEHQIDGPVISTWPGLF